MASSHVCNLCAANCGAHHALETGVISASLERAEGVDGSFTFSVRRLRLPHGSSPGRELAPPQARLQVRRRFGIHIVTYAGSCEVDGGPGGLEASTLPAIRAAATFLNAYIYRTCA